MVSLRELALADAERVPPAWLYPLLAAKFFEPCPEHPGASRTTRSGGCNQFCTVCTGRSLCHVCVEHNHAGHLVIQIRRSSKNNVVKVDDVAAMLDVSEVQFYNINNERVVFLNPRPQSGKGKPGLYRCDDCNRGLLHEKFRFCSIGCKLECMEWDFDIWLAVQPKSDSEPTEPEEFAAGDDDDDDDSPPRPAKQLRMTTTGSAARSAGRNGAEEDDDGGAGPSTAAPPAGPSSAPVVV